MGLRLPSLILNAKQICKLNISLTRNQKNVPKGHLAVYVGESEKKRFVVPVSYLSHPCFQELLTMAEEEFGFDHPMGGLTIPYPAIKLFGKTIQLLPDEAAATSLHDNKKPSREEVTGSKKDETSTQPIILEDLKCSGATSSGISEDPKTPPGAEEPYSTTKTNDNSDPNETSTTTTTTTTSEEKTLKKPDKILPCPRCNSMDTKFCYYNNYNVNQPRHFCKNCQRYWTAGGSMRNVPVGSGRRKNKASPASHYRQIIVPETLQPVNGAHLQNNNGQSILAFGSDEPLCQSMASVLNLADKSTTNRGSSSNQTENVKTNSGGLQGPPPPFPCFPAPPWPWTNQMPPPVFGPSTYPVSFYPVPQYWGYTTAVPNPWNMPLLPPESPTLGKHYREGPNDDEDKCSSSERGVLIPKTLRINDPNEAAKSSIWSTLGINNENGSTLYRAFRSKGSDDKNHAVEASSVLQANPAALSRSLNFHETS